MIRCMTVSAFHMRPLGRIEEGTAIELPERDFARLSGLGCVITLAQHEVEEQARAELAALEQRMKDAAEEAKDKVLAAERARADEAARAAASVEELEEPAPRIIESVDRLDLMDKRGLKAFAKREGLGVDLRLGEEALRDAIRAELSAEEGADD